MENYSKKKEKRLKERGRKKIRLMHTDTLCY